MLKIQNYNIVGNTFEIREELKSMGCYFNHQTKQYKCDKHTIQNVEKFIHQINAEKAKSNDKQLDLWEQACKKFELEHVSKMHPMYNKVLEEFKSLKTIHN
jgi:hypothetical protein